MTKTKTIFSMIEINKPCSVKSELNASVTSIDTCQPTQSAQVDKRMPSQSSVKTFFFSFLENVLHVDGLFHQKKKMDSLDL